MWEGQATSRNTQKVAGFLLGLLSLPFALLGFMGISMSIASQKFPAYGVIYVLVGSLICGVFGLVLAYRLVFGRGVRQGGGVMSPIAYRIGGFLWLIFAIILSYVSIVEKNFENIIWISFLLFLSFIFFVAARHRGAMRNIH